MRRAPLSVAFLLAALALPGCLRGAVVDARIAEARASAEALETLGDTEVALAGTLSQLAELEGLYRMAPHDDDVLFALVRGWTTYGTLFLADAREAAAREGNDRAKVGYEVRERHALERAVGFGLSALAKRGGNLDEARRTRESLSAHCEQRLTSRADGELAYFVGRAWLARSRLAKGDPTARVFEPFVGLVLLERSNRLAPGYAHFRRFDLACRRAGRGEDGADEARRAYEVLLEKTQRKALVVQLEYALRVACPTGDTLLYERLLNEVLGASDPGLDERLANVFAKRRAARALAPEVVATCKAP